MAGRPITEKPLPAREGSCVITVEMAISWLTFRMAKNRPLRMRQVKDWVEAHRRNNFLETATAIGFDTNGNLINGQHRLCVIIISRKDMKQKILLHLPDRSFSATDIGAPRTAADVLHMQGVKSPKTTGTALKMIKDYHTGKIMNRVAYSPMDVVEELLQEYQGIEESVAVGDSLKNITIPSAAAAMHYLFKQRDRERASRFFEMLRNGSNPAGTMSVTLITLRDGFLRNRKGKAAYKPWHVAGLMVAAWNAYSTEKVLRRLNWDGEPPFPTILGLPYSSTAMAIDLERYGTLFFEMIKERNVTLHFIRKKLKIGSNKGNAIRTVLSQAPEAYRILRRTDKEEVEFAETDHINRLYGDGKLNENEARNTAHSNAQFFAPYASCVELVHSNQNASEAYKEVCRAITDIGAH